MSITRDFDSPRWLGLQIDNRCRQHKAKRSSHQTKEHTQALHTDICFCFPSNCTATRGRLGTRAHGSAFSSASNMSTVAMWLVMKESGSIVSDYADHIQIFTSFHHFGWALPSWGTTCGIASLCCGPRSESVRGKECRSSSRKNQSLLALEGTPALIKPNQLILLIWKLRPRPAD